MRAIPPVRPRIGAHDEEGDLGIFSVVLVADSDQGEQVGPNGQKIDDISGALAIYLRLGRG